MGVGGKGQKEKFYVMKAHFCHNKKKSKLSQNNDLQYSRYFEYVSQY